MLGEYFFTTVRRVTLNARFEDADLERLKGLRQLRKLVFADSRVTAAGVAKLREALPNCEMTR